MITINKQNSFLKFLAIKKEDIKNDFISKQNGATTFISEDKTIYFVVDKKQDCPYFMKEDLKNFFSCNKYDLDIDVDSFININSLDKEDIIKAFCYAINYNSYKKYTLKTSINKDKGLDEKIEKKYNFSSTYSDIIKEIEREYSIVGKYMNFARSLQDAPPNLMYAEVLAEKIKKEASEIDNLEVEVLDKKQIQKEKMGLLLSVNSGSQYEPRVVVLKYNGNPESDEVVSLVGKGITFDTGGYSLKPSPFMKGMKFDMSGAAIVCSSIMAIAKNKSKVNMTAVTCITDNAIGAKGTVPESVITSMSGQTVQIDNTDAEGRLVLADGITYSIKHLNATKIIEASTLTGAILIALGFDFTGVFSNDKEFANEFIISSRQALERTWYMPLSDIHRQNIRKTPIADMSNIGTGREAGSSTAAAFLDQFTEKKPFIHLDIAGTAKEKTKERGTGIMINTIFNLYK